MTTQYIILDWTGKICFHGITFDDFEAAWGHIREFHAEDEEAWQEYEVVPAAKINKLSSRTDNR